VTTSLPVLNLSEARFECIFGRGCDGICCQEGEPPVEPEDIRRIEEHLARFLPDLRPGARRQIEEKGILGDVVKDGEPTLAVHDGWCVFFNQGCVLHKVGAAEGDRYRYKPSVCAVFPLEQTPEGEWYVRQHGYKGEQWDLFCLSPTASPVPALESLADEIRVAATLR
jgi:Fe-S-cluster containining protein